jgi:exonuclease I
LDKTEEIGEMVDQNLYSGYTDSQDKRILDMIRMVISMMEYFDFMGGVDWYKRAI